MKKYTLLEKIKHFFSLIGYICKTTYRILRDKRTWIAVLFIVWSYAIAWFNSNYYTQSPVKEWQPIIVPRYNTVKKIVKNAPVAPVKAVVEKKALTDKEIIYNHKYADILWRIYGLESSYGKNDGCKDDGQFNGYGFAQNTSSWNCFTSFEIVTDKVDLWIDKQIKKGLTVAELLCLYNTGTISKNCMYYTKYLSL